MGSKLAIECQGRRIIPFLTLKHASSQKVQVTTIKKNQSRAIIKLLLLRPGRVTTLKEIEVKGLSAGHRGYPIIDLTGKFDGTGHLSLKLLINGRFYQTLELDLGQYLKHGARRRIFLLVSLTALVLLFLLVRGFGGGSSPEKGPRAAGSADRSSDRSTTSVSGQTRTTTPVSTVPASGQVQEESTDSAGPVTGQVQEESTDSAGPVTGPAQTESTVTTTPVTGSAQPTPPETTAEEYETGSEESGETDLPEPQSIREGDTVYFDPDSARLLPSMKEKLAMLLPLLAKYPDAETTISGHCALFGTELGREELSLDRALQVKEYLQAEGWKPSREPVVQSFGGRQPVSSDPASQHLNRRVDLEIFWQAP